MTLVFPYQTLPCKPKVGVGAEQRERRSGRSQPVSHLETFTGGTVGRVLPQTLLVHLCSAIVGVSRYEYVI